MDKKQIWNCIDKNSEMLCKAAKDIWDNPELAIEEDFASRLQADILEQAGMRVTRGLGALPTALLAEYGNGGPVIGILGEYDALEGMSQAVKPVKEAVVEGGNGHGCGHNLLGVGGLGAALAIKEAIESGAVKGTVRYYGCPAEEDVGGKLYMLRDGYFDGCDAALYWHPSCNNAPWRSGNLADVNATFTFKGVSAHAAQPHLGRSALDAVELMNVGANYLREHLERDIYLHYSILDNGIAPNTVPDYCQVWYMMRAPKRASLELAFKRLCDVARGAALMTGTTLSEIDSVKSSELISNGVLADILLDNMNEVGGPRFTDDDYEFGRELTREISKEEREQICEAFAVPKEHAELVLQHNIVQSAGDRAMPFSGDYDVSWVVPFGAFNAAAWPIGVFAHTWQSAACTGSRLGFHGMLFAAKVLAGAAFDLLSDETRLAAVKAEFQKTLNGRRYVSGLPADAVPRRSGTMTQQETEK